MAKNIYSDVREKIGSNFNKHRTAKGYSYRDMEAITGIDYSWISKFEKGKVNCELDTLIKLASGLKIQLRDLLDFKHGFVEE